MIELTPAGDRRLRWTFAGDTLNCAAAISAAVPQAEVSYLTGVGDDPRSADFLDFCRGLGVDATRSAVVPGRTLGIYWISTDGRDRRFDYWRDSSAARALLETGLDLAEQPLPDLLVLSGITVAVAGEGRARLVDQAAALRRAGAQIAFDTNYRPQLWPGAEVARLAFEPLIAVADIVHASAEDVAALWSDGPAAFADRSASGGAGETLVTAGDGPTEAIIDGERVRHEPEVVSVVDSTGAGDAFFGTYLGHRLQGASGLEALERATEVATRATLTPGALGYLQR